MVGMGCLLSSEEFGPRELVRQARWAEQAGFDRPSISDHYHPWNGEQGNSPFVWSVIGTLSEVTALPVTTAVTCPTVRIHPAVVAQTADLAGRIGDGLCSTMPDPAPVARFRSAGGAGNRRRPDQEQFSAFRAGTVAPALTSQTPSDRPPGGA